LLRTNTLAYFGQTVAEKKGFITLTTEEWKCQPKHWLSPEVEFHEIVVGAFSLALGSFLSATMACWVMNDGYSTIYFDPVEILLNSFLSVAEKETEKARAFVLWPVL
jgi:hypothetical protein